MDLETKVIITTALTKGIHDANDAAREDLAATMRPGDRKALYLGDTKVGTATMVERASEPVAKPIVYNVPEFLQWCLDTQVFPNIGVPKIWYGGSGFCTIEGDMLINKRTGEAVPGVTIIMEENDTKTYLQVRDCKAEQVLPLIAPEDVLEAITAPQTPLLEEGE